MDLIPAIDLLAGNAVRLVKGDYQRQAAFLADPAETVAGWVRAGVGHLHLVDLDGARDGRPQNLEQAIHLMAAARTEGQVTVEFGGGLRSPADLEAVLDSGIDLAVLGTAAIEDPELLDAATARWPGQIGVSLDVRGEKIAVDGWRREGLGSPLTVASSLASSQIAQLIVTDTRRDGTGIGVDPHFLHAFRAAVPSLRLVAAGGIGRVSDLHLVAAAGLDGAVVGLALYDGSLTIEDGLTAVRQPVG